MQFRTGIGIDFHQLVAGRDLIIGGVKIPHHLGALGHSDADVLLHAICDALLGALALGDIGQHFPDTDENYKNVDSKILLHKVAELVWDRGWNIV
ncbi:MAG TPA: 2-C-methyl-D-erythritol 2,4-cyclodiphosphate synthase, partial [Phnomibacter sp.]|nr:2-C-methyl-D-erythritol 2,4-cyclodiphosphate synthase [Phnomibacter sp.]